MAPTVGDALQHPDELAAADAAKDLQGPIWSVASSARYKRGASFRKRWRLGLRKPHAREAVPLEIARKKMVPFKEQAPSQFWCGEMLYHQAKCFILILFTCCLWKSSCGFTHSRLAKHGFPVTLSSYALSINGKAGVGVGHGVIIWRKSFAFSPSPPRLCACVVYPS